MDLATLKASHPDTYKAAVAEGEKQERDRVSAHLIMGEASGDMVTAIKAVNDGEQMTATLNAKYMAAGFKKGALAGRAEDDTTVATATNNANTPATASPEAFDAALDAIVNV